MRWIETAALVVLSRKTRPWRRLQTAVVVVVGLLILREHEMGEVENLHRTTGAAIIDAIEKQRTDFHPILADDVQARRFERVGARGAVGRNRHRDYIADECVATKVDRHRTTEYRVAGNLDDNLIERGAATRSAAVKDFSRTAAD